MSILDHVAITVPCGACGGEFNVPASVVAAGQKAIAPRCPGCSDYECEARFVAGLVDPRALEDLQAAWARFEASATSHGGRSVVLVSVPLAAPPQLEEARERRLRAKAIQRWETEGGRIADPR